MAVAIAGGYLLGRSHKTRLAVLMALMAAGGRLPVDPVELLHRTPLGAKGGLLNKLTGDLRTQLVDAGKSVATTAASNRIDSLSDKLQQRANRLRIPDANTAKRRPAEEEPRERPASDEYEEYADEPEEPVAREAPRRAAPLPRQEEPRRRAPRGEEAPLRTRARR